MGQATETTIRKKIEYMRMLVQMLDFLRGPSLLHNRRARCIVADCVDCCSLRQRVLKNFDGNFALRGEGVLRHDRTRMYCPSRSNN